MPGQYLVGRFTPTEVGAIILGYVLIFALGASAWGFALAPMPRVRVLPVTPGALLGVCGGCTCSIAR